MGKGKNGKKSACNALQLTLLRLDVKSYLNFIFIICSALLQEMEAVKEFIEKHLPRIWPHLIPTVIPWDTDLSPPICHSPTGNSHEHPLYHTRQQNNKHIHENTHIW